MFGTMHTIKNMGDLLKIGYTKHSTCAKAGYCFFMLYYFINFFVSMIIVGGMYASMNIFFSQLLNVNGSFDEGNPLNWCLTKGYCKTIMISTFLGLIFSSLLVSLLYKVEKAGYFYKLIAGIAGLFMLISFSGILFYLASGIKCWIATIRYDKKKQPDKIAEACGALVTDDDLSPFLLICGVIIISV